MNNAERVLRADVREQLDKHLDAVEQVLADVGVSRSERRSICDEIEAQACEMVWERAEGEPTEQYMRAVLAELDDPEAFREAAEPDEQVCATHPPVASSKVHRFALCAFMLPPASLVLLFFPIPPQAGGEVAGSIFFGVVAFVSIVFATLAIHDIRRAPDRYFGTALALFGALAFPLLILNTIVVFNVSEINPFSNVLVKQEMSNRFDRMEVRLRQMHIDHHGPDVPFEPTKPAIVMSESETWIAENSPMLPLLTDVAIIGSSLVFSILLPVWLYRRCRPRDQTMATGTRVRSRNAE